MHCDLNFQALLHCPSFVGVIADEAHSKTCHTLLGCTLCTINQTWKSMKGNQIITPYGVLNLIPSEAIPKICWAQYTKIKLWPCKFHCILFTEIFPRGLKGIQQDAQEFLVGLLNLLALEALKKQPTWVQRILKIRYWGHTTSLILSYLFLIRKNYILQQTTCVGQVFGGWLESCGK